MDAAKIANSTWTCISATMEQRQLQRQSHPGSKAAVATTAPAAVQLDYPSVRHWEYIITFAVEVQFQIRDQFWIPHQNLHEAYYLDFLVTSQNVLVWLCTVF